MAIALPGPDRLPPGPVRDFVEALHSLYDSAGQPAARRVSRAIYDNHEIESVSHETVAATLRGQAVPAWDKVKSIVFTLYDFSRSNNPPELPVEQESARFQQLWVAARRADDARRADRSEAGTQAPQTDRIAWEYRPPSDVRRPAPVIYAATRFAGPLPDLSDRFTGRELLIDTIRERFDDQPGGPLVLHGMIGTGKTQLARAYAEVHQARYELVCWVPGDTADGILAAFGRIAEALDIVPIPHHDDLIPVVRARLESQQIEYLMVVDGAEAPGIDGLVPRIGGDVIVTTRDPTAVLDNSRAGIEVPDLDPTEAVQFLRGVDASLTARDIAAFTAVTGRSPLALEILASLRPSFDGEWSELLQRLNDPDSALLSTTLPMHYPRTFTATLAVALERLANTNPVATEFVALFEWFGNVPVPVAILEAGASGDLPNTLSLALQSRIDLSRLIRDIGRHGLARRREHAVEASPLIRLAMREVLPQPARAEALRNAQEVLAAADAEPGEPNFTVVQRDLAPHVGAARLIDADFMPALRVVCHQIRYHCLVGSYDRACDDGERAVRTWIGSPQLGAGHELVLAATREWANAARAAGRYALSRQLTEQAMASLHDGANLDGKLAMARSHAADLRIAGAYRQAFELDSSTYYRHRDAYGDSDERTIASEHNLAVSHRLLGEFTEAERIDRKHVHIHRAKDEKSRLTLLAVNALAENLLGLGRFQEALRLQQPILDAGRGAYGRADEAVSLGERIVALAFRRLGRTARALPMLRTYFFALDERKGPALEHRLAAAMSYANVLREHGKLEPAATLAERTLQRYQDSFDLQNPLTLTAMVNVAAACRARGEPERALALDEEARQALSAALGSRHPFTIVATINRATDAAIAGDRADAWNLSEQAHRTALDALGESHPDTLAAAVNLAIDRIDAGHQVDGRRLHDESLGRLRRTLGAAHPIVAAAAAGQRIECDVEPPST